MQTYIPTKEELQSTVEEAVEKAVKNKLPELIKRATQKEYYTITEVCKLLDISRRHLQYLRDSGQLSYVKNGRKVYFKREDIEAFFQDNYIKALED